MHNKRYIDSLSKDKGKLVTKVSTCLADLALPPAKDQNLAAAKKFPFLTPQSFLARINPGDPTDPLLLQVLPSAAELKSPKNFIADPLLEAKYNPIPGLLHKYRDRVLIILTNVCVINCRYCFRREFAYSENTMAEDNWQQIIQYLQNHPEITEVIFSGGDPLTINNNFLAKYMADLAAIPHLTICRIHSRVPIAMPARIEDELIAVMTSTRLKSVLVNHCNHPNEINAEVALAFNKFSGSKITLLNQAVLLRGVNDNAAALVSLSRKLFAIGVLPYYLHMPDKVVGTAHFDVTTKTAKALIKAISAELPGYLVPRLVREKPGSHAKCAV